MNHCVDWPKIVADLAHVHGDGDAAAGTRRLANALAIKRSRLRNLLTGTRPRHDHGEQLIELWCRHTGKSRDYIPMQHPSLSAAGLKQPA